MENNLNNLLFITVEDVKASKLWQPINDRKQSAYNDNLIYNAILKTSLWMDRLSGGTISDKINKKNLFPWVKKDNTGLIEYDKWLSYIQSACLLAVINWYLPKGVNDLTGSASFSQGGVAYSQTNDPEANENITRDVKNALKLAGEIIDIISSKTKSRPYNYSLDNYTHPWEKEYKHISKKTFYPTLLFWLKERLQTDNSINITYPTINDFSKIDYNEYIKLIVPFDNNTIYYENNVWKAKQSSGSDIKIDNKTIIKNDQDELMVSDLKQNKITLLPNESGRANADFNAETGELRVWDPSFGGGKNTADYDIIDSTVAGIESTDDTFGTTKYIDKFFLQKKDLPKIPNDWELVDTSDFNPDGSGYFIKDFNKTKYQYKLWAIYKYQQNITLTPAIETPINYNGAIEWTRYIPTQDNNLIVRINTKYGNISFGNFGKDILQNIILYRKLVS